MTLALLGTLAVLALVDSTSFGTLLIPIWLMLAPGRLRVSRILIFLATVAVFYLVLGLLLTAGVASFSDSLDAALDTTPVQVALLVAGALMLVVAFAMDTSPRPESGRLTRWRERAVQDGGSARGLMALAVAAAMVEAASMLPYLGAIGLIGTAEASWPVTVVVLVGYCVVMILPAVLLLALRVVAARAVEPVLRRVNDWMTRHSRESLAWLLGIIGLLLAGNAAAALQILD
jgi:hypothetical protein